MSRRSLIVTCCLLVVVLGVGGWFWNQGERLSFSPPSDSSRTFKISQKLILEPNRRYGSDSIELSAVLNARVTGVEKNLTQINMALPYALVRENSNTLYNSEAQDDHNEVEQLLRRLLTAGVTTWVDSQGRPSEIEFTDTETFTQLSEAAPYLKQLQNLQSTLRLGALYQPHFPVQPLKEGLSWHSEPFQAEGLNIPSLRYEVTRIDPDQVTITVASVATGETPQEVEYRGFLEVERETGWPLRARFAIHQPGQGQAALPLLIQLSLHQPGYEFETQDIDLEAWAYWSHQPLQIDLQDTDIALHFLNETIPSREEQLEVLRTSALWFPPIENHKDLGLLLDTTALLQAGVMPLHLRNIRLLDQTGQLIRNDIPPDPRFEMKNLLSPGYDGPPHPFPFSVSQLSEDELDAIQHLELDLDIALTGDLLKLQVDRQGQIEGADHSNYQIDILHWGAERAILRISHQDGAPLSLSPLIPAVPLRADNQRLPEYTHRISTSELDKLRSAYLKTAQDGVAVAGLAQYLNQHLFPVPEDWLTQDRIVDLQAQQPFDKVELHLKPTLVESYTLRVPNAAQTIRGGDVTGILRLEEYQLPKLEFLPLALDEIKISGVQNGQLSITLPEHGKNRCTFEVLDPPQVAGSPLSVQPQQADWYYSLSDPTSLQLATEHGLTFFYDLKVAIQTHCITRIETRTEAVDASTLVRRIDPYTIELSEKLFNDLTAINALQENIYSSFPFIGRNADGEPLTILSHWEHYQGEEAGLNSRRLRFWGEVAEVTYPVIEMTESRRSEFQMPPLP